MAGKTRIKDIVTKNINIKTDMAKEVFSKLGIDPQTQNSMDVKKAIFEFYGLSCPDTAVHSSRKSLAHRTPNNAYGIEITDNELSVFMDLFSLTSEDWFQESIGHRVVNDILSGKAKVIEEEDDERAFPEGRESYRLHRKLERDGRIPKKAKSDRLAKTGKLECDVCGFDFSQKYGLCGHGFIEAHHKIPVSKLRGTTKTKIQDIALVCSNCHRMLHRGDKLLTVKGLRGLIQS